jgi:hypothetical protein
MFALSRLVARSSAAAAARPNVVAPLTRVSIQRASAVAVARPPFSFRTVVSVYLFAFSLLLYHLLTCSRVSLLPLPVAKRYTNDHEWVEFDTTTGHGTVSITDYAQKSLGDVVFVELPAVGAEFAKGGPPIPSGVTHDF